MARARPTAGAAIVGGFACWMLFGAGGGCGGGFTATPEDGGGADVASGDAVIDGGSGDAPRADGGGLNDGPGEATSDGGCLDCSDPSCMGVTCVHAPTPGWTLVAVEFGGSPDPCPPLYGPAIDLQVAGGPQSCGCSCAGGGVTCSGPPVTIDYGNACSGGSILASTSGCNAFGMGMMFGGNTQIPPLPPQVAACTPQPTKKIPPEGMARVCPTTIVGTGCNSSEECAGEPDGFKLCWEHSGTQMCSTASLTAYSVGDSIQDQRDCTMCTCNQNAGSCTNETMTLYELAGCLGNSASVNADNICHPLNLGAAALTYSWSAKPVGGDCTPVGGTAAGTEVLANPMTLCCP